MEYQFDEQEVKIRKKWLFATKLYYFGTPLLGALCIVCLLVVNYMLSIEDVEFNSDAIIGLVVFLLGGSIIPSIFYFIMVRCAYEKPGTKWLTCLLILNLFSMLGQIGQIGKERDPLFTVGLLPVLGLCAFWMQRSLSLRKLNKKVKAVQLVSQLQSSSLV